MTWLSILDRFRPAGAPGSAGVAGVPALDDHGPATELAAVFAALAPDQQAAADLVEQARRDARAGLDAAALRAASVVAQAHLDADAARSRAAAAVQQEASASDEQVLGEATDRVARLREVGRSRAGELAPRLAAALLDLPDRGTS